jgi:hypothetical protein
VVLDNDQSLTVHLRNSLPVPTSIVIPAQREDGMGAANSPSNGSGARMRAFTREAAPAGGTEAYTWSNLTPGTYLYHSGSHVQVQVPMGLYGGLKYDDGNNRAYPGVNYDNETMLLFSEVDPILNAEVAMGTYGTPSHPTSAIGYRPQYFLINGAAYNPTIPPIPVGQTGDRILLRLVNAGLRSHVPTLQNGFFHLKAEDGHLLPHGGHEQYSALLPAGKTLDAMWVPTVSAMFPLYDSRLNDSMLVKLAVGGTQAPVITSIPVTTAAATQPYAYQVIATDPDQGDVLTYRLTTAPAGMTISATGLVQWIPAEGQFGVHPVVVRAQDQGGHLSPPHSYSVTVAPLPPAVVKFIVRRADTDVVIVDPLTDGATVDLFALCGGVTCEVNIEAVPSVSPIESATMVLSGATTRTRTDSTSPYSMQGNNGGDYAGFPINRGVHTFTATPFSADNAGGTAGTPLAVTFTVVLAPVITSPAVTTATLGDLYTYNVNAQPLAAGLTFSLTQVPPADRGVMTIDPGTGLISWTPAIPNPTVPNPTVSYSNDVTVRVTDNQGRFTEQTFTITVSPPPSAILRFIVRRADTDVVIVDPLTDGATVDLFALCGGVTCEVNIEAVGMVPEFIQSMSLVLSGATTRTRTDSTSPYSMQGNNGGDYAGFPINRGVHTFTATPFSADNAGGTAGTPLAVTFTVVLAPVITSPAVTTATLGDLYTYNVNAQPLAAGLTFSLTQVPPADRGVMTIDPGTGLISWTPAIPNPTVPNPTLSYSNNVTVRVTDNQGRFTEQTFTITVSPKAETITVTQALFTNPPGNNNTDSSWTISGTSTVDAGDCTGTPNVCGNLTIYRVRGAGVLAIGTATVNPTTGAWSFTELPADPVASQAQGDTIRVRSLTGGVVNSAITFDLN